jgi:hypothetical protein
MPSLRTLLNPVALLGVAVLLVGGTGVATAATGGTFLLGRNNTASAPTGLYNTAGTALKLTSKGGTPPLTVSNSTKVPYLNSDLVDGLTSSQLQRRITGTCTDGALRAVGSSGGVYCAAVPRRNIVRLRAPEGLDDITLAAHMGDMLLWATCSRTTTGARFNLSFEGLHGSQGTLNGYRTATPIGGPTTTTPVGVALPSLDLVDISNDWQGAVIRQQIDAMAEVDGSLTQLTMHVMLDLRDASATATPCNLWLTAV